MPGTRYFSSFDSIERWQGASLPGDLPLNGSYKHYARSASTDSLDSSGTGTTTSSSSHCGAAGRSRKASMEGPGESTRTGVKTPVVSHNPWQFVKVDPVPLYKKAVDQMKMCEEIKTVQDYKREEEELWQRKLDSWKSRRKKVTERTIQRVEDLKLLQQDEYQTQRNPKTKTFSEIVENRAQKPRSYNLSIHGENERNQFSRVNSFETDDRKNEDYSYAFQARRKSEPAVKQNYVRNQDLMEPDPQDFTFSNIKDKFEILEEDPSDNPKEDSAICMEEDCESCGRYNVDLVLESFNCSQRSGETQDRSPELSLDNSEDYRERTNEYEFDGHSSIRQGESSEPIVHDTLGEHLQGTDQADSNVQLSMRLCLNSENEDFGFKIREENGMYLVDVLKNKGAGMRSGLKLNDRILALNEKTTSGRSKNSVQFAITKSVYNGYLNLQISRRQNEGTKESEECFSDSVSGKYIFSSPFNSNSQDANKHVHRDGETFGDAWKSNKLNGVLQSSEICKDPEPRTMKGTTSTPSTVGNVSSSSVVGEAPREKEQEKTCSVETFKFSSPTSVSILSGDISDGEKKLDEELFHDSGLIHRAGVKHVSFACASTGTEDRRAQLQSISSNSDFNDAQQEETIKPPECEKLSRTSKHNDDVNEENGLTIIYESYSPQRKSTDLTTGFSIEPVADETFEKTNQDVPITQRLSEKEYFLDSYQDDDANRVIPPTIIENNSTEKSFIDLSPKTESQLQLNRQRVSEEFGYCDLSVDSHKKTLSPSEESPKQTSPASEIKSDAFRGSYDSLDMISTDNQMDNDEQKLMATDTRTNNKEQSECVQSQKQCQEDEKTGGSLLGENPSLKDEEKLFKEREEALSRRKKEIELEMKSLLWEEYNLQKEKEEYRHRVLLEQRKAHDFQSYSGTEEPSQL